MTSTGDGLAERILPARGAAQKATASITEQLSDSSGHSEVASPSSSNPFREPAHRTKSVKYRYTATGKHLSSPLKGSSSSPERKPEKPKKSKLATLTPAPPAHAHKAIPSAVATTSRKRKTPAVSLRKEDALGALFISSPSPLSSVPSSPIVPAKDLPSSLTLTAKDTPPDPPKRLSISKTFSLHALGNTGSKSSSFSQPLSPKRKLKKNKSNAQKSAAHPWDIGNSVWVRITQSGVLADNNASSEPLLWWPAQVVQKQPLRVSMFGEFPSSSSTSRGLCTIFAPSSSNVLSISDDSGAKRFSRTTFLTSLAADDDAGPLTKKPRLDDLASVEARWESAVQSMGKASTLEQDGLPALLSTYATTGGSFYDSLDDSDPDTSDRRTLHKRTGSTSKKSKQTESTKKPKPQRLKQDPAESTPRHGTPCPPDLTLQIPGELILAMAPKTGSSYWPAQILKHVPDVKEKYLVKFLDDEQHAITRDKFFTSEEDGFVQCALGEWESAIKTIDDPESEDEDGKYPVNDANGQDLDDGALPPPPAGEDFEDLSVRAQVAYVKPVLRAILINEYAPARGRHEAFMRGGSSRAALLKSAGVRGGMDTRFVKAVQKVICQWVLGECGMKPERLDTGDILTASGEVEGGASVMATSSDVRPAETMSHDAVPDDKMEGIESTTITGAAPTDKQETMSLTTPNKQVEVAQVVDMAVDRPQQDLASSSNGVTLSPAIKQATLAPRSQLDLLAEVSQAVATEPSLLHSHPELPRLKTLLDMARKDTSCQPSPLTSISDEEQSPPRRSPPVVCQEFESLSGVEKLDYCLNVLLPESIQQLLLWRSGKRTSVALLSPEEERRLHDVGASKAAETDWVDDLMRLRAAQARLQGIDLKKKAEGKKTEVLQGGTRSRPRRGTISRP